MASLLDFSERSKFLAHFTFRLGRSMALYEERRVTPKLKFDFCVRGACSRDLFMSAACSLTAQLRAFASILATATRCSIWTSWRQLCVRVDQRQCGQPPGPSVEGRSA
ncbi:hypothetical protein Tcan_06038 [Toxocara canis]|uniref:Uncharacterized protein n=1 Tax=Toxocara canis TaxID=6265 RepID=A0A0B2V7Q1_TOXCA|nr:hypothetical protein Tcan_06038 [Toxocara canis]